MALAPAAVPPDSTNSRQHRGQLATAVNAINARLFKPNPVASGTAAGDATASVSSTGNAVLIAGSIRLTSAAVTFSLKRGTTVLNTWGVPTFTNLDTPQNIPFVWIDIPGTGNFSYATDGGGLTSAASLSAVEFK